MSTTWRSTRPTKQIDFEVAFNQHCPEKNKRCGFTTRFMADDQATYSDLAIEVCLTFASVFRQPLRQAQGIVRS